MRRWEFMCIETHDWCANKEFVIELNALGAEGWELITAHKTQHNGRPIVTPVVNYWFKRPIESK